MNLPVGDGGETQAAATHPWKIPRDRTGIEPPLRLAPGPAFPPLYLHLILEKDHIALCAAAIIKGKRTFVFVAVLISDSIKGPILCGPFLYLSDMVDVHMSGPVVKNDHSILYDEVTARVSRCRCLPGAQQGFRDLRHLTSEKHQDD